MIYNTKEYEEAKAQLETRYTEYSVTQEAIHKRINELKKIITIEEKKRLKKLH